MSVPNLPTKYWASIIASIILIMSLRDLTLQQQYEAITLFIQTLNKPQRQEGRVIKTSYTYKHFHNP